MPLAPLLAVMLVTLGQVGPLIQGPDAPAPRSPALPPIASLSVPEPVPAIPAYDVVLEPIVHSDTVQPPLLDEPRPALGEQPEITPGGAFVRSLILPGWGHASTGSHFRGAFYVAAQSGAVWMLSKSLAGHREARRMRDQEILAVRGRLRASGVVQADSLRVLTNQDARVQEWEDMVDRRSEEVEDWVAAALVILLIQAADAFVAGHLMDHPEPLSMDISPGPAGGWQLGVRMDPGRLRLPWR